MDTPENNNNTKREDGDSSAQLPCSFLRGKDGYVVLGFSLICIAALIVSPHLGALFLIVFGVTCIGAGMQK